MKKQKSSKRQPSHKHTPDIQPNGKAPKDQQDRVTLKRMVAIVLCALLLLGVVAMPVVSMLS